MNIPEISRQLSKLQFVEEAGAAPTDIGNIPCWQIKLSSLVDLNDEI